MADLPILIYIAKNSCPACVIFNKEWEKIKMMLNGRAIFVKFACQPGTPGGNVPPVFDKYFEPKGWFPTLLLAEPKSYYTAFTPNDQVNTQTYSDQYIIKAKKFNAVKTQNGYEYAGRPNTAENILLWFNQVSPTMYSS